MEQVSTSLTRVLFTGPVTLDGGSRILLSLLNNGVGVRTTNVPQFDLTGATLLAVLNQGDGVRRVDGTDFRITLTDGATVDVDITPAMTTVQQVIDAITIAGNTVATGRLISVFIDPDTLNSIVLNDTIDGGGNLTVTALNNSASAIDLGILREGGTNFSTARRSVKRPTIFESYSPMEHGWNSICRASSCSMICSNYSTRVRRTFPLGSIPPGPA